MKFDPKTHKVIIETLNKTEAKAYVTFLAGEEVRHHMNIYECADCIEKHRRGGDTEFDRASIQFWQSAVSRHLDDISDIKALIEKVRELFE